VSEREREIEIERERSRNLKIGGLHPKCVFLQQQQIFVFALGVVDVTLLSVYHKSAIIKT
jgi:hypothetical protein